MALPPAGACQYTPDRHERTVAASGYRSPGGSRGGVGYSEPTRTAHTSRLGPPAALRRLADVLGLERQFHTVAIVKLEDGKDGHFPRVGPGVVKRGGQFVNSPVSARHRQRPPLGRLRKSVTAMDSATAVKFSETISSAITCM